MGLNVFLFLFVHIRFFMKVCSVSYATKGQLISKYIFGVFNSPKKCTKTIRLEVPYYRSEKVEMIFSSQRFFQKRNERILLYYYETSGQLFFVCFLEEIEDTKKTFRN